MANKVKLKTLIGQIRERGEIREVYISDSVLIDWINSGVKDLYEQILTVNQDYFVKISGNISVVSGQEKYPLPEDFASLLRAEVLYSGSTDWRKLDNFGLSAKSDSNLLTSTRLWWRYRVMGNDLYITPTPTTTGTVRLWYAPVPPTFSDNDEIDFIFGWDEYVQLECLVRHADKEESDPTSFMTQQAKKMELILSRAKSRDLGEPNQIRDVEQEELLARFPWNRT